MAIPKPPSSQRHAEAPAVGSILGGYRVEAVLGAGGMGAVVAATRESDGHRVAIKTMLRQHTTDRAMLSRFEREGKAAKRLTSEHAVKVFDVGTADDGTPFIVMELLEGAPLNEVARGGQLPIEEAVGYVVQVCDALAEAHRLGIIHRDIKPGNLFLANRPTESPIIKVVDFGISKTVQLEQGGEGDSTSLTSTGAALGSPLYMSPEQLRNSKGIDARSDIWALGLVLHRLIAGRAAFEADSIGQHLLMIMSEPPTPLRVHRPDTPPAVEAAVLRCLERDPDKRFRSVGQLAQALLPHAPADVLPIIERIGEADHRVSPEDVATVPDRKQLAASAAAPAPAPRAPSISDQTTAAMSRTDADVFRPRKTGVYGVVTAIALVIGATIVAVVWRSPSIAPSPSAQPLSSAPSATSAASATVTVTVDVTPGAASLDLDGSPVKGPSISLAKGPSKHAVTARAPGYHDEVRWVSAEESSSLTIVLTPLGAPSASAAKPSAAKAAAPKGTDPLPAAPPPSAPAPAKAPSVKLKGPVESSL